MHQLMATAFQCDATRVITFMMANSGSGRKYDFLGVSGGHHDISHHQSNPENFEKLKVIDRWEMQRFAHLLGLLEQMKESDGTSVLDSTAVFFSSEISDGDRHNHDNLPVLLAGGLRGAINTRAAREVYRCPSAREFVHHSVPTVRRADHHVRRQRNRAAPGRDRLMAAADYQPSATSTANSP